MAVNGNGYPPIVERMAATCATRERREPLYFDGRGRLIPMTGWKYGRTPGTRPNGSRYAAGPANGAPGNAVYIVEHPFRPSAASLADMVIEHTETGEPVTYDEERWEADPRVLEQAGPSILSNDDLWELMIEEVRSA